MYSRISLLMILSAQACTLLSLNFDLSVIVGDISFYNHFSFPHFLHCICSFYIYSLCFRDCIYKLSEYIIRWSWKTSLAVPIQSTPLKCQISFKTSITFVTIFEQMSPLFLYWKDRKPKIITFFYLKTECLIILLLKTLLFFVC